MKKLPHSIKAFSRKVRGIGVEQTWLNPGPSFPGRAPFKFLNGGDKDIYLIVFCEKSKAVMHVNV